MIKRSNKKNKGAVIAFCAVAAVLIAGIGVFAPIKLKNFEKTPSSSQAHSPQVSAVSSSKVEDEKLTKTVPVLMYHSIAYEKGNILRVPGEDFESEMKWLKDNGCKTLTMSEAYEAVSTKKGIPEKSVVITFDDGYIDNYTTAFPIMKKYGFKGTVFMITKNIDDSEKIYLTSDMLKEMDEGGMEIQCHTVTHPDLDSLSYDKQLKEVTDSKASLEKILGHSVDFLAFPSGKYNDNTIKACKEAGFKMCFKMKGGQGTVDDDIYAFPRFFVGSDLEDFKTRILGTANYSK